MNKNMCIIISDPLDPEPMAVVGALGCPGEAVASWLSRVTEASCTWLQPAHPDNPKI